MYNNNWNGKKLKNCSILASDTLVTGLSLLRVRLCYLFFWNLIYTKKEQLNVSWAPGWTHPQKFVDETTDALLYGISIGSTLVPD